MSAERARRVFSRWAVLRSGRRNIARVLMHVPDLNKSTIRYYGIYRIVPISNRVKP